MNGLIWSVLHVDISFDAKVYNPTQHSRSMINRRIQWLLTLQCGKVMLYALDWSVVTRLFSCKDSHEALGLQQSAEWCSSSSSRTIIFKVSLVESFQLGRRICLSFMRTSHRQNTCDMLLLSWTHCWDVCEAKHLEHCNEEVRRRGLFSLSFVCDRSWFVSQARFGPKALHRNNSIDFSNLGTVDSRTMEKKELNNYELVVKRSSFGGSSRRVILLRSLV